MYNPYSLAQQQAAQQQEQPQSRDWWGGRRDPTPQQQMEMAAFKQALAAQYAPPPMQPPPMMPVVQYQPLSYAANIAPFLDALRPSKMSVEQERGAYGDLGIPQMRPNPSHKQMLSALRMMRFGR